MLIDKYTKIDGDIERLAMNKNNVLIRIFDNHDYKLIGDTRLYIFTNINNIADNIYYRGEVTMLPAKFHYKKDDKSSPDFDTEIELIKGDIVYGRYLDFLEGEYILCNEELYVIIPYERLWMATRNNDIIMLNGNIAVSQYQRQTSLGAIYDNQLVVCEHTGKPLKEYRHYDYQPPCINANDVILHRMKDLIELQTNIFPHYKSDKKIYIMHSSRVVARVIDESVRSNNIALA